MPAVPGSVLNISVDNNGNLNVGGNVMGDKICALGMLKLAEKVVEDFNPEAQPGILLAQGDLPLPPPNHRLR